MKIQGSWRFILAVLAIIVVVWAGWQGYAAIQLSGVKLTPIEPGAVNLVAISPRAGYKIVIANQLAYLAKVEQSEDEAQADFSEEGVANASRLPLRELLQTLQGDEKAFGTLIMKLNDLPDTDTAMGTPVWKAEDVRKALDGDAELQKRLEANLNVGLDGFPLDTINVFAINAGIIVESPVTAEVTVGDAKRKMTGRVQEFYKPQFCSVVESKLNERFNPPASWVQGVYRDIARPIIEQNSAENVKGALENRISQKRLQGFADKPVRVLQNTSVLLTERHLRSANSTNYDVGQGETSNDVTIVLTEEGRMRLWKYSHDNPGFQLLFIVDSIAVAAPKIATELAESRVTIRRVPSQDLAESAVATINKIASEKK